MESDAHLSPMVPSDRPEAYPADLEQWVVLEDGTRVFVRPMVPDDVSRIAHAFEVADIDTIRRRFFTGAPPTDRTHLELSLIHISEPTRHICLSRMPSSA